MSDASRRDQDSIAAVTVTWMVVQTVPLVLCAMNVPLWARSTSPGPRLAIQTMVSVQVGMSALLFPWLLASRQRSIIVMVLTEVFVCAAGVLAGTGVTDLLQVGAALLIWLVALRVWSGELCGPVQELIGVAVASCVTIGGAISAYLWSEFAERDVQNTRVLLWTMPVAVLLSGLWARRSALTDSGDKLSTNSSTPGAL